uniref:Uncharacterized protein n=1 Tax=Parascaris equorum TaxID=6256 RepID=A0A914RHA6_PAREQ
MHAIQLTIAVVLGEVIGRFIFSAFFPPPEMTNAQQQLHVAGSDRLFATVTDFNVTAIAADTVIFNYYPYQHCHYLSLIMAIISIISGFMSLRVRLIDDNKSKINATTKGETNEDRIDDLIELQTRVEATAKKESSIDQRKDIEVKANEYRSQPADELRSEGSELRR